MKATKEIWKNGKIIPWGEAQTHVLTHSLHYGSGVFEGIRFYKTDLGSALFKLEDHIDRFFYSAAQLEMKIANTKEEICQAALDIVRRNGIEEGYVRPLAYYGYGSMHVVPTNDAPVEVVIACWPWGDYLPVKSVDIVTSPYIRIHPRSTVVDAKICGHYINSILAGLALRNTAYHEALLLDAEGYVAEGSAENIFIVKNGKIITPPIGTILAGITRNIVIQIAEEFGIDVEQRCFKVEEIYDADEAFFCGTAVEVTAIRSLDDKIINPGNSGPITEKIKECYQRIVHGEVPHYHSALTWIRAMEEMAV